MAHKEGIKRVYEYMYMWVCQGNTDSKEVRKEGNWGPRDPQRGTQREVKRRAM